MTSEIAQALHALAQVNPFAAGVAVVVLAMIGGVILFGRSRDVFAEVNAKTRADDFQSQLLAELKDTRGREGALRAELAASRAANEKLSGELIEVRAEVTLMREQLKRLIETLRDVREGRLAPSSIPAQEGL